MTQNFLGGTLNLAARFLVAGILFLNVGCQSLIKSEGDGQPLRSFEVKPQWIRSTLTADRFGPNHPQLFSPILFDDLVIAGNSHDNISAYRQSSGALVWRLPIPGGVGPATLMDGALSLGTTNGQLLSVDARTGQIKWSHTLGAEMFSAPALDDSQIYALSSDGRLHVLDRASGRPVWSASRPSRSTLTIRASGTPLVRESHVAIGFPDGTFVKFDKKDGSVVWERRFDSAQRFHDVDSSPVYSNGIVFVSSYETALFAMDWGTGELKWSFPEGGPFSPLLYDGSLYFSSSKGVIYKINPQNGVALWDIRQDGEVSSPLGIQNGVLFHGLYSKELQFRDTQTGRLLGTLDYAHGLQSAPTFNEESGHYFVISGFGNLYKLRAEWTER